MIPAAAFFVTALRSPEGGVKQRELKKRQRKQ